MYTTCTFSDVLVLGARCIVVYVFQSGKIAINEVNVRNVHLSLLMLTAGCHRWTRIKDHGRLCNNADYNE